MFRWTRLTHHKVQDIKIGKNCDENDSWNNSHVPVSHDFSVLMNRDNNSKDYFPRPSKQGFFKE